MKKEQLPDWNSWLAAMDMYVFDQLRKGNIAEDMRILDAGCGHGRNAWYFLKAGAELWAFDHDAAYVEEVRSMALELQAGYDTARIQQADGASIPFDAASFDVVISSAVLHFARDDEHFDAMMRELVRVLAPEGILIIRVAMQPAENVLLTPLGNNHFAHPDGMDYYLPPFSMESFVLYLENAGLTLIESPKLTQVHGLRAMSTWVVKK